MAHDFEQPLEAVLEGNKLLDVWVASGQSQQQQKEFVANFFAVVLEDREQPPQTGWALEHGAFGKGGAL